MSKFRIAFTVVLVVCMLAGFRPVSFGGTYAYACFSEGSPSPCGSCPAGQRCGKLVSTACCGVAPCCFAGGGGAFACIPESSCSFRFSQCVFCPVY